MPSSCLHASDVSRLLLLGDFTHLSNLSRPLRAIQLTLKQTARSDCVNWQLEVSNVACSCHYRTAEVLCQIFSSLWMSHLLQGISNGSRHLCLSTWTETLVLAHLPAPLWQYWLIIIDYDQSTDSRSTCRHHHADANVCLTLMLKPTQVLHTSCDTQQHHRKVLFSLCIPPHTAHFPKEDTETAQTNLASLVTCHWCCRNRLKDKPYSVG